MDCCAPGKPLPAIRNSGLRRQYFLLRSTAWLSHWRPSPTLGLFGLRLDIPTLTRAALDP